MMEDSKKLDLFDIISMMPYSVVLRASDKFPEYDRGTDVDILCKNVDECVAYIKGLLDVREIVVSPTQVHLDYFVEGNLELKFDLYGEYISWEYTEGLLNAVVDGGLTAPEFYDNVAKCYEFFINKKGKYKNYAKYLNLLDEYYFN